LITIEGESSISTSPETRPEFGSRSKSPRPSLGTPHLAICSATVAAVQSKSTFQFGNAGIGRRQLPFQRRNLLAPQGAFCEQQLNLLNQPLDVGGSLLGSYRPPNHPVMVSG
jgi:hypothetical protein